MKRFLLSLFLLFSEVGFAGSMSPNAAVEAARKITLPESSAIFTDVNANEAINAEAGSTKTLEALRQTGGEKLYEPGRSDVDKCYGENSVRCAAVRIVDRGAANRPTVDPDPTGDVAAALSQIQKESSSTVGETGLATSVGSCRRVKSTLTQSPETWTCDIRTSAEEGTLEEKTCFIDLETLTQTTSRYRCEKRYFTDFDATITVPIIPVVTLTTTVSCLEGKRNAEIRKCNAPVSTSEVTRFEAHCVTPIYRITNKTCRKSLRVKPTATCTPGTETFTSITDSGTLTEDEIPGADTLKIAYRCNAEGDPRVIFGTNTKTGGAIDLEIESADTIIDAVKIISGNTLRFEGTRSCEETACRAKVKMTVFRHSGDYRIYIGELQTTLFFTRFVRTSEVESWEETCE